MRAPICTAIPPRPFPITSHSPVYRPPLTSIPGDCIFLEIAQAHRTAVPDSRQELLDLLENSVAVVSPRDRVHSVQLDELRARYEIGHITRRAGQRTVGAMTGIVRPRDRRTRGEPCQASNPSSCTVHDSVENGRMRLRRRAPVLPGGFDGSAECRRCVPRPTWVVEHASSDSHSIRLATR